jgi:hypothetical protein
MASSTVLRLKYSFESEYNGIFGLNFVTFLNYWVTTSCDLCTASCVMGDCHVTHQYVLACQGKGSTASVCLGGGIYRAKVGTCSYCETFEKEWSPYFFIWAATKTTCVACVVIHVCSTDQGIRQSLTMLCQQCYFRWRNLSRQSRNIFLLWDLIKWMCFLFIDLGSF